MNYKKLAQEERDRLLKSELDPVKIKIIDKFGLKSTTDLYWISERENAHPHIVFKHNFAKKSDIISIIFRVYGLCFAKLNYFKKNIDQFQAYKYDYKKGFIKTELWDVEFFKHLASEYIIDIRQLLSITQIEKFHKLCKHLESFHDHKQSS